MLLSLILLNQHFSALTAKKQQPGTYSSLRCALGIMAKFMFLTYTDHSPKTKT